jgi:PASTA domain
MADQPRPAKKENVLTRKIGPLSTWVWIAIAGGAVLLWALYERHNSSSAGATSGTASDTQPPEVIQTTPPEINIYGHEGGTKPNEHHGRHGFRKVTVPDVIGQQYEAGAGKVSKAGLTPQRSSPFVGKVTRESPSAGSHVARGTTVTLSGRPWPQTQFRHPPKPGEKKAHKGAKVNPGGQDKKAPVHKKRRKPKITA